jgi:sucrose-6-phosphate hydrolase SacC (GH32 family)
MDTRAKPTPVVASRCRGNEVFAGRGHVTITNQVFPRATSDRVQVFAKGGSVEVESLDIRPLRSSR